MTVRSSDEIVKRARELEMLRRLESKGKIISKPEIQEMMKTIRLIEVKIDKINEKLNKLLERKRSLEMKDVHRRILNLLDEWISTESIAKALGYSHEYTSRKVSELKEMDKIEEKRSGKYLYYRKKK